MIGYQYLCIVNYRIRLAFARDQIEIFYEMVKRTKPGTEPESETASAVRDYYPSGTKQVSGSQIDGIVELCRQFAIDEIARISSGDTANPNP